MYIYSKFQLRIISLLECIDMDILMILKTREILFANSTFMRTTGLSIDDVIGVTCDAISTRNSGIYRLPFVACPIERIITSPSPQVVTDTFTDNAGSTHIITTIGTVTKISDSEEAYLYMSTPSQKKTADFTNPEPALIQGYKLIDMLAQIHHQEYEIITILDELTVTKKNLESKTSEINHIYNDIVNRELKMIELKKQISLMESRLNQVPPHVQKE